MNLPHTNRGIPYSDLKYEIDKYIISNWLDKWNNVGANKLCWEIGTLPTDDQDGRRLSFVVPILGIQS